MSEDFKMSVSPNSPFVSVGAKQRFSLSHKTPRRPGRQPPERAAWKAVLVDVAYKQTPGAGGNVQMGLDAKIDTAQESTDLGALTWEVTWQKAGLWHITAKPRGTDEVFQLTQEVVEKKDVARRSEVWPESLVDPRSTSEWGRRLLDAAVALASGEKKMNTETQQRHDKQVAELRQYVDALDGLLVKARTATASLSFIRGVWAADVVDQASEDVVEVRGILYHEEGSGPGPLWVLIDWTNPTAPRHLCVHEGRSMVHASSIIVALEHWAANSQYPAGTLTFEIDGLAGFHLIQAANDGNANKRTLKTNDSFALRLSEILDWVSLGTFVLGIVAIATGVGVAAAPALFAISTATSVGAGAAHLTYLINVGSDNWRAHALDALGIAGGMLGLRGTGAKLFRNVPVRVKDAANTKYFVWAEIGTTSAELTLVTEGTANNIQQIIDKENITPRERLEELTKVIGGAAGSTALMVWGIKQNTAELKRLEDFLKSAEGKTSTWPGNIQDFKKDGEVVTHQHSPDQSLIYSDQHQVRAGAAHAAGVVDGSLSGAADGMLWTEGTHWHAWESRSGRSGAAGVLQLTDGRTIPGRSDGAVKLELDAKITNNKEVDSPEFYVHIRSPELRESYALVPKDIRSFGHGSCAEVFTWDDAITLVGLAGLKGAVSDIRYLTKSRSNAKHGTALPACTSCFHVATALGLIDLNSVRRTLEVPNEALTSYLQARGFPANWPRADEAIRLLEANGFPVSPAIAAFIRQFGSLSTIGDPAPRVEPGPDVKHGAGRFEFDPIDVCDDVSSVQEREGDLGITGLCPVGMSIDAGQLLVMDQRGRLFGQRWVYEGTPIEVITRLLGGRPSGRIQ